jgi:hypothetical protein
VIFRQVFKIPLTKSSSLKMDKEMWGMRVKNICMKGARDGDPEDV